MAARLRRAGESPQQRSSRKHTDKESKAKKRAKLAIKKNLTPILLAKQFNMSEIESQRIKMKESILGKLADAEVEASKAVTANAQTREKTAKLIVSSLDDKEGQVPVVSTTGSTVSTAGSSISSVPSSSVPSSSVPSIVARLPKGVPIDLNVVDTYDEFRNIMGAAMVAEYSTTGDKAVVFAALFCWGLGCAKHKEFFYKLCQEENVFLEYAKEFLGFVKNAESPTDIGDLVSQLNTKFKKPYLAYIKQAGRQVLARVVHPADGGGCLVGRTVKEWEDANITMQEGDTFHITSLVIIQGQSNDSGFPFRG